jgi:tRNA threonylcarbamoyl adenosine modification protein YjeE
MALAMAKEIKSGDWILLEGPLGVGKTTFARLLLSAMGVIQRPEGSPTFALVHEYFSHLGNIAHIDFYRLNKEVEIDEAGISEYFWINSGVVLSEWTSLWPNFKNKLLLSGSPHRLWEITLCFSVCPTKRNIKIGLKTLG